MQYLYGFHDPGGEHLFADRKGWITFTEAIGSDPNDKSGRDYRQWSGAGYGILVRLNNGYGSAGTIPTPDQYGNFAWRVAHFVAASKGADTWIIGNETNHSNERPDGQPITVEMYVDCFKQVYAAVRDHAGARHGLIPAPVALWNVETGDWLEYQQRVWNAVWRLSAGFAIHTYTHGAAVNLITSMERMAPPFADRFYHFMAYRQLMTRVPQSARGLPVYITETDQNDPWTDANSGWVQAAYDEIDRWNATDGTQKIYCLCLYRWPKHDQWSIVDKPGVHADLRAAVGREFRAPVKGKEQMDTHIPVVSPGTSNAEPSLPPRQWDERLTARGVTIETPPLKPGQQFWRIVKARWWNEQESQGRHHIYVEAPDGTPFVATWPTGNAPGKANGRGGFDAGNFPMSKSLNEFSVRIDDGKPSETLKGIGMGDKGNSGIHTSTGVVFQLATVPAVVVPTQPPIVSPGPQPVPPPITGPTATPITPAGARIRSGPGVTFSVLGAVATGIPMRVTGIAPSGVWYRVDSPFGVGWVSATVVSAANIGNVPVVQDEPPVQPPPQEDTWARSLAFTLSWEGLWADDPNDKGKATMKGVTIGTYTRWRKAHGQPPPTKDDLRNISDGEVETIYREWYWIPSGAAALPWPQCLAVFDLGVIGGPDKAKEFVREAGTDFVRLMARRILWHTNLEDWHYFGYAWTRRCADLMKEGSKP